jgi:hypothetical protein
MGTRGVATGLLALAAAAGAACSDRAQSVATIPGEPLAGHLASGLLAAPALPQPAPGSGLSVGPANPELVHAVAIRVRPWTTCTISPEGASGDQTRTATVSADADGELRFFRPSDEWGTRLALQCSADGASQAPIQVDLNDASTFTPKSFSDLQPRFVRTRPALTGDLTSMSAADLLQQGYPPRPDAVKSPQRYAIWAQHVASPMRIYKSVPTTYLGASFGVGLKAGDQPGPWTGFVQDASGFTGGVAKLGTLYDMYFAETLLPAFLGCPSGDGCITGIWAGIGGYPSQGVLGGTLTGNLIQNGVAIMAGNVPSPGPGIFLFTEFAAGNGTGGFELAFPPPNDPAGTFDTLGLWGWSSNSSGCALLNNGAFGCFSFDDYTQGWGFGANPVPAPQGVWWPTTVDYAIENPFNTATNARANNADYGEELMEGDGWDNTGAIHEDPGNSAGTGDPYEHVFSGSTTAAVWANDLPTPAVDPITFFWQGF